jgi:hypothetical protein
VHRGHLDLTSGLGKHFRSRGTLPVSCSTRMYFALALNRMLCIFVCAFKIEEHVGALLKRRCAIDNKVKKSLENPKKK